MIELRLIEKRYGDKVILRDLELDLQPGARLGIEGASGSGKTTLLRILCGLDRAISGRLRYVGMAEPRIGLMFQEPSLIPWRDNVSNLTLTTGIDLATARQWMARIGLADKEDVFPGQLSLGQQRRLALARTLAWCPDVIVLDEPFASLDQETKAAMVALLEANINEKMIFILASHDDAEHRRLTTRRLILATV